MINLDQQYISKLGETEVIYLWNMASSVTAASEDRVESDPAPVSPSPLNLSNGLQLNISRTGTAQNHPAAVISDISIVTNQLHHVNQVPFICHLHLRV
jgi:hypothetical protein